MKKFLLKSFALLAMLMMSASMWADWSLSYKKDGGAWTYNVAPAGDGKVHLELDANETYYIYALIDGNGYAWERVEMSFGNSKNYELKSYGEATSTGIHFTTLNAGEYVISLSWYDEKQHITVDYPYAVYLPGSWNDWAKNDDVRFDVNNMLTLHLEAGSYTFKAVNNDGWYGNGGTMNGPQIAWEFTDANSNCTLNITEEGDYTFSYGWMNNSKPKINVFRADVDMVSSSTAQQSAYNAIDVDAGSRWESVSNDDQWWLVKYAEPQTFDNVVINWEGAYGKQFNILGSNDGVNWTNLYTETNQTSAGEHTYELTETAVYQWVKFQGVERATGYGYSFFDFKTIYLNVPVPTNVAVSATGRLSFEYEGEADSYVARIYDGENLISSQEVVSGDVLRLASVAAKTYTVKMVAKVGENTSKESTGYDWSVAAGRVFGASEYCNYHTSKMADNSEVALTWKTDIDGNVIIAISGYNGTTDVTYRGNGLGSDLSRFKVLSGDGFTTEEDASTYFTRQGGKTGDTELKLVRNSTPLPYPCKIMMASVDMEWYVGAVGRWHNIDGMTYIYGTTCRVNEGMPGNVSVSTMGRVRHDNVDGAVKYAAVVIKDGAIVLQQDITSGAPLNWIPTVGGTYKVTVIAFDAEGNMFDVPAEVDWTVEAGHVYGATNVFAYKFVSGDNNCKNIPAYFTYETRADGAIVLTITDNAEGVVNGNATFRSSSLSLTKFTLNGSADDMAAKFEKTYVNNSKVPYYILTLKDGQDAPAAGSTIAFNGQVTYVCGAADDAWPTIELPTYIYGTPRYPKEATAPVIASFTGESNDYTTATLTVAASDKDDDGLDQTILTYSLEGDNGFGVKEVTPEAGIIALTDLKKNVIYHFTLTVTDPSGNSAQESVEVKMKWDASENLALKKPTETSHYQGDGVKSPKAVDGDEGTFWTSYGGGEATPQWWTVDMGELYAISRVRILFNDHAGKYNVLYSADGTEWHTYLADFSIDNAHVDYTINQVASVRYFKFTTTNSNVGIKEFEVYGTGYASADATAPVVTATEVAESATTTSVKLHIVATDEDDNHAAQPMPALAISGDNGFAKIENVELDDEGNILIEGLKNCMKSYTFRVTATDLAGNSSFTDVVVKLPFDLEFDLTKYATAEMVCAGYSNGGDSPIEAVQESGHWGTYGISGTDEEKLAKNWWAIDLGDVIKIHRIKIDFEAEKQYNIEASFNSIAEIENGTAEWYVVVDNAEAGDHDYTEMSFAARSIRIKARSTSNIGINRINIYGTGFTAPDTKEPVIANFSNTAVTTTTATFHVEATDINDAGEPQHITYMLSGDHEFAAVEVTPNGEGNFTIEKLHPNYVYQFQLTAIDEAANSTLSESVEVVLTWDNDYNLALDGQATCGYRENDTYAAAKAIDGSAETKWNTWNVGNSANTYADNWMQVQLEETYSLTKIAINFDRASKNYSILGSLDGENWYLIAKEANENRNAQVNEVLVSAPAKYVRFVAEGTTQDDYVGIFEFEVYASGFATVEDSKPEITIARQESLSDVEVSFLVDAMDVTTHPITTYVVTGIGAEQVVSPVDHKLTFNVTPNTHYNVSIKAKDAEGNLSDAKEFEFTTEGSAAGLYLFSSIWGWTPTPAAGQFTTTDVAGVESMSYTNTTAADKTITYKMWNATDSRATFGDASGTTNHELTIPAGETVTFYATSEDQFLSTLDDIYLVGSLVGEEKQLEWNADHTVGIWRGTINLEGDKKFNLTKKSGSHSYNRDFYAAAQIFEGDYTRAVFTLDLKHMTGTWSQLEMVILDQTADNTVAINGPHDELVDVTFKRSFIADGYWYTLCLPFDLSAEQLVEAYGEDYDLRYLASSYMKGSDVLFLNFEKATELQAGMPYMFKPTGVAGETYGTETPTVFRNVKIDTKTPVQKTEVATMYGYYLPMSIDASCYVLGTDDYLYHTDGAVSNAFRCYFQLNPSTSAPVRARVVFGSQVTTGIEELENSEETQKVIRNGQLYIIRDGKIYTTQGLLVK